MIARAAVLLLGCAVADVDAGVQRAPGPSLAERGARLLFDGEDRASDYQEALGLLGRALQEAPDAAARARLHARRSEAFLRLADVTTAKEAKLALYDQGRQEADRGIAVDRRCADCWFWRGANVGRYGQTRGVLDSLFLLDDVRGAFEEVLAIEPGHLDATLSLGKIDEALPFFAGGSTERAERRFRSVVEKDPRFTRALLDLAELLARTDRREEARLLCRRVLEEPRPRHQGEHRKFDVPRARRLLEDLGG